MKIDILTLFPKMFEGPLSESIVKRAKNTKLVQIKIHNLRNWTTDKHNTVDDKQYGGGAGMVLRVDVVDNALQELKTKNSKVILLSPQGKKYNQKKAKELAKTDHLILIAGHYEGFDERIREHLIDEEISIGDYVLTGGEIPAMVITDSIVRLIPGVINPDSLIEETHSSSTTKKKYPVYTKPENYRKWRVPEVLLSGNHEKIEKWRKDKTTNKF